MPEHRSPRILITGFGLVTPLGHSAWETFAALLAGRTLADRAAAVPDDIGVVDLVKASGTGGIAQHTATDPTVELAERAAREALAMAGVSPVGLPCIIGTSKGAVQALIAGANRLSRDTNRIAAGIAANPTASPTSEAGIPRREPPDAPLAVALGPHGYLTHHLRQRLSLGLTQHLVTACASGLTALHRARLALLHGPLAASHDRILVVTADAALSPMFIHGYRRLGVLAPVKPDAYRGRPLDEARDGFMIAEAGAAVVVERVDDPDRPTPRHAVELLDTDEACDAHDLIRPCADMPALKWIASRLLRDRQVDLIHPHAPGTVEQDAAEMRVYRDLLASPRQAPDFYAHKGALGHTLGASGLVSTVIACLCAASRRRPPMPWLERSLDETVRRSSDVAPRTQAVFAAGFGGHAAGAALA